MGERRKQSGGRVLIVDDDPAIRDLVRAILEGREDLSFEEASDGDEAISLARATEPDVIVLDIMMPGRDGFAVADIVLQEFPATSIVMLTARGGQIDRERALGGGVHWYLTKPFSPLELIDFVDEVCP